MLLTSQKRDEDGPSEHHPAPRPEFQAAWTEGPYLLNKRYGDVAEMRLLQGHVLIWVEETVTYRLESDLPLAEAVQVAESLR